MRKHLTSYLSTLMSVRWSSGANFETRTEVLLFFLSKTEKTLSGLIAAESLMELVESAAVEIAK